MATAVYYKRHFFASTPVAPFFAHTAISRADDGLRKRLDRTREALCEWRDYGLCPAAHFLAENVPKAN
ncbi:MAG TPA: hypothetical protein VG271_04275, partial [Beijerinckiaceae bacterium]|nr:hypothetical protein [Beijerinckiaceae bacterium]